MSRITTDISEKIYFICKRRYTSSAREDILLRQEKIYCFGKRRYTASEMKIPSSGNEDTFVGR
ncbi:MAG: hypothetical protein ACI3X7_01000 [Bacteroidaceae bacterium]